MRSKLGIYPRGFWVLLVCFFVNRIGAALVWPYLALFMREQTGAPLSTVTALLSLQALASVLGTSAISVVMDRVGRKKPMLVGLVAFSAILLLMSGARGIEQWLVLIPLYGILQPVFYVGANAMVADLVQPDERTNAYAIVRTGSNLAIAVGAAIGGFVVAQSHLYSYQMTAVINVLLVIPVALLIRESLPKGRVTQQETVRGGYGQIFRDRPFVLFIGVFTLLEIAAALVFNLMSVYTKENFGMPENEYGMLLGINATMVVLFQYGVTQVSRRAAPLVVLGVGALFYTMGLSGYALAQSFPHFALGMVVMTIGEMMVAPTSNGLVANMAPTDMRARYMGIYSLTYTMGTGVGPVVGGLLSGAFAPAAIWYGGAFTALLAAVGFFALARDRQIEARASVSRVASEKVG
ncbi:MAG: MFS transporter [Anaerolineae bacterium]|nr:MFS transporter [Anaerolineae bacterium]